MTTRSSGFTLIELLVVVAILGIIAAIGIVSYNGYVSSAKRKSAENIILQISLAQAEYFSDRDVYYYTTGCDLSVENGSNEIEKNLLGQANVISSKDEGGYTFCITGVATQYQIRAKEDKKGTPCELEYNEKMKWTRKNC